MLEVVQRPYHLALHLGRKEVSAVRMNVQSRSRRQLSGYRVHCDAQLISLCHQPGHRRGSRNHGAGTGKCMSPWIQALGTLFCSPLQSLFAFLCSLSLHSRKLLPASGDGLSPLGVGVIGVSPLISQPIMMIPLCNKTHSPASPPALHKSPAILSVITLSTVCPGV